MQHDADAIVVGAGLAGLAAAAELVDGGRKVILLDQEPEQSLGGQAWWSFGGLFFVDSPEQRRLRIRDSQELAWQDWLGTAGFDRPEDEWPRRWAQAYVDFAAGEKRAWLHAMGHRLFPIVGWAERGGYDAPGPATPFRAFTSPGAPVPGIVEPFERRVRAAAARRASRVPLPPPGRRVDDERRCRQRRQRHRARALVGRTRASRARERRSARSSCMRRR